MNQLLPDIFNIFFTFNYDIHKYFTRQYKNIYVQKANHYKKLYDLLVCLLNELFDVIDNNDDDFVINVFRRQGCPHLGQGHGPIVSSRHIDNNCTFSVYKRRVKKYLLS